MSTFVGVTVALGLVATSVNPTPVSQSAPDFSGTWELVEASVIGAARGGETANDRTPRPTSVNTLGGAAFNCGRACSITHANRKLTVSNAELADFAGRDKSRATPTVSFSLDGRWTSVVDSFSPSRELDVMAAIAGRNVEVASRQGGTEIRQVLSLQDGQLTVNSVTIFRGERRSEMTFRYKRR